MQVNKKLVYDLIERALKTALAFALGWLAFKLGLDPAGDETGSTAANGVSLNVLLNLLLGQVGDKGSASLLPSEPMVDDQRFRWIDFPHEFEVINPDDSIAWTATFADGAWEAVDEDEDDEDGEVA